MQPNNPHNLIVVSHEYLDVSLKKGLWSTWFLDTFVQEINNKLVQKLKL